MVVGTPDVKTQGIFTKKQGRFGLKPQILAMT
jgi:hypothetical protein